MDKQLAVNSLEEPANHIALFSQWICLTRAGLAESLLILYAFMNTARTAGKIATYTIKEAQLIGRGASIALYCGAGPGAVQT